MRCPPPRPFRVSRVSRLKAPATSAARVASALFAALATLATGCSEVIGLGPEPTLQSAERGICGLAPHPSAKCDACTTGSCCDQATACADNPTCLAESRCALGCAFDTTCIAGCTSQFNSDTYATLQSCLLGNCLMSCLPTGPCLKIIDCCQKVPVGNITHDACVNATNGNDEPGCQSLLDSGLLTPYCPGL